MSGFDERAQRIDRDLKELREQLARTTRGLAELRAHVETIRPLHKSCPRCGRIVQGKKCGMCSG
jgi:recombinational DNA repair protein RecR